MATIVWWLFLGFFVGSLAIIWWVLFVEHDLEPESLEDDGPHDGEEALLAGMDGVSLNLLHSIVCLFFYDS